jgi:hypothetical protein
MGLKSIGYNQGAEAQGRRGSEAQRLRGAEAQRRRCPIEKYLIFLNIMFALFSKQKTISSARFSKWKIFNLNIALN